MLIFTGIFFAKKHYFLPFWATEVTIKDMNANVIEEKAINNAPLNAIKPGPIAKSSKPINAKPSAKNGRWAKNEQCGL